MEALHVIKSTIEKIFTYTGGAILIGTAALFVLDTVIYNIQKKRYRPDPPPPRQHSFAWYQALFGYVMVLAYIAIALLLLTSSCACLFK